jgi:hypothetical protein
MTWIPSRHFGLRARASGDAFLRTLMADAAQSLARQAAPDRALSPAAAEPDGPATRWRRGRLGLFFLRVQRVRWDAAIGLLANGQAVFFDALNPGVVPLPNVTVRVAGNEISATVPLALLPSQGASLKDYRFNFWPRSQVSLANTTVADFAPDNGDGRSASSASAPPSRWCVPPRPKARPAWTTQVRT